MKAFVKNMFLKFGLKVVATKTVEEPHDMEAEFYELRKICKAYTMTSTERLYSVYKSISYIVDNNIAGDIVECGVWKGGSSMMAALTLMKKKDTSRTLYLYDTYEGMSSPTEKDKNYLDQPAGDEWEKSKKGDHNDWCYAAIDEVKNNLKKTGYPIEKIKFIKGLVEETIPKEIPEKISVLRLDTDWYESTYHELKHLYPRLEKNGVLLLDDYGFWKGARDATDAYFKENNIKLMLNRVDAAGRMLIKNI